jgi:tRNA(fMet)-specific endonuclease VapC
VTYLLDTDACVAIIRGSPPRVRARFARDASPDRPAGVSSVTAFELWYGAVKSAHRDDNLRAVDAFFAGDVEIWPFEDDDARVAGGIRAELEASGKVIGPYDVLIAGQAMRHGVTLVTANAQEFGRVRGLKYEDWAK